MGMTLSFGVGALLIAAGVAVCAGWFTLNFLTRERVVGAGR